MIKTTLILLSLLICMSAFANVRMPAQFSDNMVLQRNVPIPVWGWANADEQIIVRIAGKNERTVADKDGSWRVSIPKLRAGGPYKLYIKGNNSITFKDVLIGEVWVCSGQSNMATPLSYAATAEQAIREANNPKIRLFSTWYASRQTPQTTCGGQWNKCTPETVKSFSAVAYFFAAKLQRELKIPVGVIQSAVGATAIESWMDRTGMTADPELKSLVESVDKESAKYPTDINDTGWQAPGMADADWREMVLPMPQGWESAKAGMDNLNGVVWFRHTLDIPANWAGKQLTLRFGPIDDGDTTYFNGIKVGAMSMDTPNVWKTPREYTVPASLVKAGTVSIAVRVSDQFGGGGILGTPEQMSLTVADSPEESISLAGNWKFRIAASWPQNELPTGLYNGMISPWTKCAIGGFLWYQGESNAGNAGRYRHTLPALIAGWRKACGQGDFPFLIVQLPNYMAAKPEPSESSWAEMREAQAISANTLPQVGLAVTIDVGDANNIHPTRKQEVGDRLALQALGMVYKKVKASSGPIFDSAVKESENAIRIKFTHTDSGLRTTDNKDVQGFAIAGKNKVFVWATAKIDGDTVIVSSPTVPNPTIVRYGWADNPTVNLTNETGLPTGPFRTDVIK
jgi:sialate O-acetylesterase